MPAVSKKQQRFFGYLLSNPEERKKKGISKKDAKDFAQDVKEGGAWTKKAGKNPEGGLNEKGRKSYERENPGSDLKAPQPEGGSRKKSFCARMGGMKKKLTSSKTANDPDSRINKALRKWKCNEAAPQKLMDFKTFMSIAEGQFAPQRENHPKELSKKLPKGYSYSDPKREGKHSTSKLQVKEKGKKEPTDTDIKVTGSVRGDKGGTSFWKKHARASNTLKGIDREVKRIRSQKKEKTPAQRLNKAYDRRVKAKGRQVLGDITKLGKSKNPRPKNK